MKNPGRVGPALGMAWAALGGVLMLVVIGAAYVLFAPRTPSSASVDNQVAPVIVGPTPVASAASPPPVPDAAPVSGTDFVITAALAAKAMTVEQLRAAGPKALCLGDPLAIRNDTAATVSLLDTPEDSDATIELGDVKPGAVFRFTPNEEGAFLLASESSEGWLFFYKVDKCAASRQQ